MWLAFKAIPQRILLLFLSLVLVTSCTIQKRLYTGGYSIEWHRKFKEKQGNPKSVVLYNEQPGQIVSTTDSVSLTDHLQEQVSGQPVTETAKNDSIQVVSTRQHSKTVLQKKSSQIHTTTNPDKPKKKLPTRPKPPKQRIREVGVDFIDDAFFYTNVAAIFLIAALLFVFLFSVVTTVTGLVNIFLLLALISLSCLTTYLVYLVVFLFIGFCYMLVFWTWKLIYLHKKRIYDEWVEAHP